MRTCMHCGRVMGRLKRCACGRSYVAPVAAATPQERDGASCLENADDGSAPRPTGRLLDDALLMLDMAVVWWRVGQYTERLSDWLRAMHRVAVTLSEIAPRDDVPDPYAGLREWSAEDTWRVIDKWLPITISSDAFRQAHDGDVWAKAKAVRDALEEMIDVEISLHDGVPDGVEFQLRGGMSCTLSSGYLERGSVPGCGSFVATALELDQ